MLLIYFVAEHLSNSNPERGVVHESGLRLERNSMWQVPHFEVGQDTPPDELHVVMLGIALHLFAATVYKISHFLLDLKRLSRTVTYGLCFLRPTCKGACKTKCNTEFHFKIM